MKATPTALPEVLLIEPRVFADDRGFFFESYRHDRFLEATGLDVEFVQDNHSRSQHGVLRGLHYQLPPSAQGKLVRAVLGEVLDVAVDIRRGSPRFGQWVSARLSAENKHQLWVPQGFAHGFLTLSEVAEIEYKVTNYYDPDAERAIAWDDPDLGIDWAGESAPILSGKDRQARRFAEADVFS